MKRILPIVLAVMLIMTGLVMFPVTAAAASAPDIEIDYSPTELDSSGSVSLSITVSNNDADITNAILSVDGKQVKDIGSLGAYETSEYTNDSYKISTKKLGTDIKVELSYSVDGTTKKASSSFNVGKGSGAKASATAGKVSLAMTASADKTAVAKNTDVTFSFAIENKGNVKVENCRIKASNLNGGKVIESFSLDSGKSKLVTYTGEVVKDMEITPTITYTANNKNYTEKMNKITVKVTDAVLDVKISPQSTTLTAGESTEVDVTLKNTGNTNLKNIVLYDNSDNKVVLPSASLDKGDSMTAKATITPAASGEIVFYAKADDGNGNTTTYNSNIVTMTINEAEPTPSPTPAVDYSAGVTVNVTVDEAKLKEEKLMSFNIAITNGTQENYSNAVVSESILGNIETISTLQPGTTTVVYEQAYTDSATYVFKVVATAPDGAQITAKSAAVTVGTGDEPAAGGTFTSLGTILIIAAILVILIIATIVLLIVFVKKGKKKKAAAANGNPYFDGEEEEQRIIAGRAQRQPRERPEAGVSPYLDEEDEREARMLDEMLAEGRTQRPQRIDMEDVEIAPREEEPQSGPVLEDETDAAIEAKPIHRTKPEPKLVEPEEPDFDDRNMF